MKHFGDITKIHGWDVPLVDIVTGGSPCQDLSVAGKRAGLAGERSGLFMEQIRIIKEMRDYDRRTNGRTDELIRPRYMVWENVCGALSSNKGEDFRVVLEETARVADKDAVIPGLAKGQKWAYSGCIMGDGWSIAWRVHDAQFWGVPQRRKRIALVADFGGSSAPEILFERKGLSGDTEQSRPQGEETSRQSEGGVGTANYTLKIREVSQDQTLFQADAVCIGNGQANSQVSDIVGTLNCMHDQQAVVYGISSYDSNAMKSRNPNSGIYEADTARTLDNNGGSPACNQGGMLVLDVVRRLTPTECERLQGFPDGWTDIGDWIDSKGKKHKGDADSPRYKALGNSIALPFWQWMAERMVNQYDSDYQPTMASLFDGIGGFPLVFSRCGCKPIWASEIEEFPIAVTKLHFPEQ